MKNLINSLIAAVGLFIAVSVQAANVAPLGLEVGVASIEQVKTRLGNSSVAQTGINAYSDGLMLESDGDGLEIEGLQKILFIFDNKNKLAGVVMTMNKHRFDEIYQFLSSKYKVSSKKIPFVGDSYVRFNQGASMVEISSPHMSFEMEVRYLTNTLLAAFKKRSAEEDKQRRQTQSNNF
jgi:hypothetical protein